MKKQLSIIALLLAATGCINKVPIDFGEVTPQLVLNAQLMAEEDEQAIYLSESTLATIKPLQGAEVTVLVDGKPYATAVEADEVEQNNRYASAYRFQGGFPAGSQVKVTAKKGSWDAWAQAEVIPRPVISAVDTLRSMERDIDYSYEVFQVKITFKDLPGNSYYRAGVRANHLITQVGFNGEISEIPVTSELAMSGSKDPVLGGATAGMSIFNLDKTYLAFSDEMFRDQEYTLRLTINSDRLYPFYYVMADFAPSYFLISTSLVPWLESISREEFDYLNALNNLENFGYTAQVIVEPTTLPTNINGGLGFFAVRNRTEAASVALPPVRIDYYYGTEDEQHAGQQ